MVQIFARQKNFFFFLVLLFFLLFWGFVERRLFFSRSSRSRSSRGRSRSSRRKRHSSATRTRHLGSSSRLHCRCHPPLPPLTEGPSPQPQALSQTPESL